MLHVQPQINDLASFMQTEVYASLDETTKAALVRKKVELCGRYFLEIASSLNRNKYKGCYAPHKAVMIMAVMELVRSGHIASNVILLDKELKEHFKDVWQRVVPAGSPFNCDYRNPFIYMASEPFWDSSNDKDKAIISWEAFYAFSHEESRLAIHDFLVCSIHDDTISKEYRNNHPCIDWLVAEDMIAFAPFLGVFLAI